MTPVTTVRTCARYGPPRGARSGNPRGGSPRHFPVRDGAQPRDSTADMAARVARDLRGPFRFPERSAASICPCRKPLATDAPLSEGGLWLELAALIYKAVTGKAHDMMPACRDADELLPRALLSHPVFHVRIPAAQLRTPLNFLAYVSYSLSNATASSSANG